ncbi:MAG TPA: AMP-binding protein, partial [Polyangiaceae bacterium]|nr:AMP-binding protein [Polyangiaceae bacterium]
MTAPWPRARKSDSNWTLGHVTVGGARSFSNAPAIADASTRLSFLELHERTLGLASQLAKLGVRRSDRVLLWATKHVECVIAMFAIARLGATFVPIDPAVPPERLEFLLQDVEARAFVGRLPLVTDDA